MKEEDEAEAEGPGPAALPLHPGLCADCLHLRLVRSPRSTFVRCALAGVDPRFPRYPRLPVVACTGYEPSGNRGVADFPGV
jgi:hypothetical protein